MAVSLQRNDPLYIQIANSLKAQIASGHLQIGQKLPSHQNLSELYDVSLITIKRALADLKREGLLDSHVGKGTFVARQRPQLDHSKHRAIGLVLEDLASPFFSLILQSVQQRAYNERYNILLASPSGNADREEQQIQHFIDIGAQGLIIASMTHKYRPSALMQALHASSFPYVLVSYMVDENMYYAGCDHETGAYMATSHLAANGFESIGYINGEAGNLLGEARKAGFLRALADHGLDLDPGHVFTLPYKGESNDYRSGIETGIAFLKMSRRPRAVFAYNDLSALGFQNAVLAAGLRVPEDVAIVGFDDIVQSRTTAVPLTTVHQPTQAIGSYAVELVLQQIAGQRPKPRRLFQPELIVRESCGVALRTPASSII